MIRLRRVDEMSRVQSLSVNEGTEVASPTLESEYIMLHNNALDTCMVITMSSLQERLRRKYMKGKQRSLMKFQIQFDFYCGNQRLAVKARVVCCRVGGGASRPALHAKLCRHHSISSSTQALLRGLSRRPAGPPAAATTRAS